MRFSPTITCDSLYQQTTCTDTVLFILKTKFLPPFATESLYQRNTLRDSRHSTTACPACRAIGIEGTEIVYGEEKHILYRANYSRTKIGIKCAQSNQERFPFICPLSAPFTSVSTVSRATPLYRLTGLYLLISADLLCICLCLHLVVV
jgi:hypothetical protein